MTTKARTLNGLPRTLLALATLVGASVVTAQEEPPNLDPEILKRGLLMVEERFENGAPEVGEPIPDLTLFGPGGEPVRLRELVRGQTTVFVVGCLT